MVVVIVAAVLCWCCSNIVSVPLVIKILKNEDICSSCLHIITATYDSCNNEITSRVYRKALRLLITSADCRTIHLTDPHGYVGIEHSYSHGYMRNGVCVWNITVEEGKVVQLFIQDYNIHSYTVSWWTNPCIPSFLKIYDGAEEDEGNVIQTLVSVFGRAYEPPPPPPAPHHLGCPAVRCDGSRSYGTFADSPELSTSEYMQLCMLSLQTGILPV